MGHNAFEFERNKDEAFIELLGQRIMCLFAGTFEELTRGIMDAIGTEGEGVLYDAGIHSGKNSVNILLNSWKERGQAFLEKWEAFYGSSGVGWFKIKEINIDLEKGQGYIQLIQSFASESYRKVDNEVNKVELDTTIINPACHFLTGFFVGVFEELTHKNIECEEVKCVTRKDGYCEFQLRPY
jgi:predicted hydrocarbon binding protein